MFTAISIVIPLVVCWFPGKILVCKKSGEKGCNLKRKYLPQNVLNTFYIYMLRPSQTRGPVNEMARIILCNLFTRILPKKLEFLGANLRLEMGWVADANRFGKNMGNQWIPVLKMGGLRNLHIHFWWVSHDSLFSPSSMGLLQRVNVWDFYQLRNCSSKHLFFNAMILLIQILYKNENSRALAVFFFRNC